MAYDNPAGIISASVILTVLATICVAARFYSRVLRKAGFGVDDWLLIPAWVLTAATGAVMIYGCAPAIRAMAWPSGHVASDEAYVSRGGKVAYTLQCLHPPTVGLIKLSVAFLYKRVFSPRGRLNRWFTYFINFWILLLVLWTLTFTLAIPLQCGTHPQAFWTANNFYQYCNVNVHVVFAFLGSNVAMDVITVIIPLPMIHKLEMPLKRKIILSLIFMIAALSVGASIGSLVIWNEAYAGNNTMDQITLFTCIAVWHLIESHVGLIAASLPAIRPVLEQIRNSPSFTRLVQTLSSSSSSSEKGSQNNTQIGAADPFNGNTQANSSYIAHCSKAEKTSMGSSQGVPPYQNNQVLVRSDFTVEGHDRRKDSQQTL